jgi:hypothetical protein
LGYWPGPLLEVFFTISSLVLFGDSLEARDGAVPHGINAIGVKQGFQALQFPIGHKGHGYA